MAVGLILVVWSLELDGRQCKAWAKNRSGVGLSIDHRLAPEWNCAVGLDDSWDAVKWVYCCAHCQLKPRIVSGALGLGVFEMRCGFWAQ